MDTPDGSSIWDLIRKNGDTVDNEHWAPVGGAQNKWIQVGAREGETCKTYEQLYHEDPSWEMSGIDPLEVTGYVMCCLPPSPITDSTPVEVTASIPEDTRKEIELNDAIVQIFDPTLYDRNKGWQGSTYDEAVQFCSERAPASALCPFEV